MIAPAGGSQVLKRAHLSLVRTDPFAVDRDQIIRMAMTFTGVAYPRPADAMENILNILGWVIEERPLPGRKDWGLTDLKQMKVWICSRLREKLAYPPAAMGVRTFTLAHELAHIRLHLWFIAQGICTTEHDAEADRYAAEFLMPESLIRRRPEFSEFMNCEDSDQGRLVVSLANWFRVSKAAMDRRFEQLNFYEERKCWQAVPW